MKKSIKRFLPLTLILAGMSAVYFLGLNKYFSFEALKENHKILKPFIIDHPYLLPMVYISAYVLLAALSIPGAILLSLLGGYLFPQPLSTLYVVVSATCGATALFLAAQTASGNFLKTRAGPFLKKMENGFQKNSVHYMLFLRLIPLFPFWLVNIVSAYFGISLKTFIWTTFLGVIPGALMFTLAGKGLEKILESQESFSTASILNMDLAITLPILSIAALRILAIIPGILRRKKSND